MSHLFTIVLAPPGTESIEAFVEKALAPFDEGWDVSPYFQSISSEELQDMLTHFGLDISSPLNEVVSCIEPYFGAPGCSQDGKLGMMSTYNPKSKCDWWRIGGRWDGEVRGLPPIDDNQGGFNFSATYETLERNVCPVSALPEGFHCWAVVTPDGRWFEKSEMGWWGMSFGDREHWPAQLAELLSAYSDHLAIGCDLHT